MKLLRFPIALFLFFVFFIWALAGNFTHLYSGYFPNFIFVLFPLLFIFSIPGVPDKLKGFLPFFEKYSFVIFPVFAFFSALYINLFVLYSIPRVQDEINMKFMADAILNGSFSRPLHPHYEFFKFLYIVPSTNGTYSLYQPGFSLLLAPFIFFKVPFLLNPLLTGGSVYFLGKITKDLYDKKTAALTMLLASTSIFLISMGGTFMHHSLCAFSTLAAFYFCNKSLSGNFYRNNLISLFFLVAIMFTRPQNGPFVLVPLILLVFMKTDIRKVAKYCIFAFLFLLPFLMLLFYSDSIFSGEFGTPKHVAYFNYSEPVNNCMGIGLDKGCRFATFQEIPEEGITPGFAFYITALRLFQLVFFLFFHPFFMLFIVSLFIFKTKKEEFRNNIIMLSVFIITFIAYFFYYFEGNVYGPRYYYEVSFFLVPLTAKGIFLISEKIKTRFSNPLLNITNILMIIITAGLIFQYFFLAPVLNNIHRAAFWGTDPLLKTTVEEQDIHNAVIFISPHQYYNSGAAIMDMAQIDENDVIYALDLGDRSNERLMHYYPNRKFYRASFNKEWYQMIPPVINPLKHIYSVDRFEVKMSDKSYPLEGVPDYCGKYPENVYVDKYAGFSFSEKMPKEKEFFFCRFKDVSQYYTFGQYLEYGGVYDIEIHAALVPEGGKFRFSSGGSSRVVDFSSHVLKFSIFDIELALKKGMNLITIEPSSDISESGQYFIIESIVFKRKSQ